MIGDKKRELFAVGLEHTLGPRDPRWRGAWLELANVWQRRDHVVSARERPIVRVEPRARIRAERRAADAVTTCPRSAWLEYSMRSLAAGTSWRLSATLPGRLNAPPRLVPISGWAHDKRQVMPLLPLQGRIQRRGWLQRFLFLWCCWAPFVAVGGCEVAKQLRAAAAGLAAEAADDDRAAHQRGV